MTDDVVIVGGGAAGIGAARRLADFGVTSIMLEAMHRISGRAHTAVVNGHALDLGCGWLHSGDRNGWTDIAERRGFSVDRRQSAWGEQFQDLGFSPDDQAAAAAAFQDWENRLARTPPHSDRASDALVLGGVWNDYIGAISGFISGVGPERISAQDYIAYEQASTDQNWRVAKGYGTLITASLPQSVTVHTGTPVEAIDFTKNGVSITTSAGRIEARAVILTASTAVLASDAIRMPIALTPWRDAAAVLPLGRDEKVFLEIVGDAPFENETYLLGNPRSRATGGYYIRPLGKPVIECFLGGNGAMVLDAGPEAGFAFALDELTALFGNDVRRLLRPLVTSHWHGTPTIGGAYSCALPGNAWARTRLAESFDGRVFFAGEATHPFDFSTAHGAHDTGVRAAHEALSILSSSALKRSFALDVPCSSQGDR